MGDTDRLVEDGLPDRGEPSDGGKPALEELGDPEALSPETRRLFDEDLGPDELEEFSDHDIDEMAADVGRSFDTEPELIVAGIERARKQVCLAQREGISLSQTAGTFRERMHELVHETAGMDAVSFTDEIGGLAGRLLDGDVGQDGITFTHANPTPSSNAETGDTEGTSTGTDGQGGEAITDHSVFLDQAGAEDVEIDVGVEQVSSESLVDIGQVIEELDDDRAYLTVTDVIRAQLGDRIEDISAWASERGVEIDTEAAADEVESIGRACEDRSITGPVSAPGDARTLGRELSRAVVREESFDTEILPTGEGRETGGSEEPGDDGVTFT